MTKEVNQDAEASTYHCADLDEETLRTKSPDRPFFIKLETNITIYVDKHDYNLYMRPREVEKKKDERRSRCIIDGKRCLGKCSECSHFRSGYTISIDEQFEKYELEYADKSQDVIEKLAHEELIDAMLKEIRALNATDKAIMEMTAAGLSTRDIAARLNIPQRTIVDHKNRTLAALKEKLKDYE